MFFSFYPTKPIGSLDGGMVVSNNFEKIKWFKEMTFNGMSYAKNNWDRKIVLPGWKMYLDTISSQIGYNNFLKLEEKKKKLKELRDFYNSELSLNNTSDHLYRILVEDNVEFMEQMKKSGFQCGIHYRAMNTHEVYSTGDECPLSEVHQHMTISIPFHEKITQEEAKTIINEIK